MKIGLLHFDLSGGPKEKNIAMLCQGIKVAAKQGVTLIITPEMAVQGYFFTQLGRTVQTEEKFKSDIKPVLDLAKKLQVFVLLGSLEHDELDSKNYNSCLIINNQGELIASHRKMKVVPSKTEAWSTPGKEQTIVNCLGHSIGVLVCADAWYEENGAILGKKAAEIICVIAAWPPGCGGPPEKAWERCSKASGGLPVIICNQTGKTNGMDCTIAKSAVVIGGKLQYSYEGTPAVLITEFDFEQNQFSQKDFIKIQC